MVTGQREGPLWPCHALRVLHQGPGLGRGIVRWSVARCPQEGTG